MHVHVDSHVFSANNLLNLSTLLLTGSRGLLINTSTFRELTVFNRSMKSWFQHFRLLFYNIIWPYVQNDIFHSWVCSQRYAGFFLPSQKWYPWENTVFWCFYCTCFLHLLQQSHFFLFLPKLLSVLTLLCEDEILSRSSDGDPGSCNSGANLFSSCTLGMGRFDACSPFRSCPRLCPRLCHTKLRALGSARCLSSHFPLKWFTLRLCTKRELQGVLPLVDLLPSTQPSCFLVVLLVPINRVLACSCPLFWGNGKMMLFLHSPFTSMFTSNWQILVSSTAVFCRSL